MSVAGMIEEARELMAAGKDGRAADVLTTAAIECRDPHEASEILTLAQQGRERSSRFRRHRFDEAIRLAEHRSAVPV